MKTFYFLSFALSFLLLGAVERSAATDPIRPRQFIYVLHLVPRLHDDKAWTGQDKAAVERHFNRLKEAVKSNQVILAGRTQDTGDKTFGIAIFEAIDENSARDFMNADPAVVAGVMTAELHPFAVALERKNP
ncbi:MAG TPA: YciI family protein [Phototrophicaceae bacterium]|nr:YciI family protein [Phototrophicaceae bacterium]